MTKLRIMFKLMIIWLESQNCSMWWCFAECYCGKVVRDVLCTRESSASRYFSCDGVCEKKLSCGNHVCSLKCHPGPCPDCELAPDKVTHCPCGKKSLTDKQMRSSCLDTIPTCEQKCNKKLSCGQPSKYDQ